MSFTTFSGPVLVGPKRDGTDRTTGSVVLARQYDTGDLTGAVVGSTDTLAFYLPQSGQILDIQVDQVVASGTGTTTVSVGTTSGGAELMAGVATTAGGRFRGTLNAATQLAWQLSTTADTTVYVRNTTAVGTLTAGRFIVTVWYRQRTPGALTNPATGSGS